MSAQSELNAIFEKLAKDYGKLNAKQQAFAIKEVGRVRGDIADLLADYSQKDGTIKRQRLSRLLRELDEIETLVRQYGTTALDSIIEESAQFTSAGIDAGFVQAVGTKVAATVQLERINKDVFNYVIKRFGEDGLVLSDRIWRLSGDMRDELSKVLRADIIRGESVSTMIANVRKVHENETWKIRRLVVTEGNTAYRTSTAYNAKRSDIVKGLLIHRGKANVANHQCTILSKEDRYGLGAGVFKPNDTEIYSPHPNCTSFLTYVLDGEVLR